tara:strand:- start:883 stop:1398 length:516 start_codon:yes stop_codon:yes gene_type:complete
MKSYNSYLNKFVSKKYRNATIKSNLFEKSYKIQRQNILKNLNNKFFSNKVKKNDSTFKTIFKIYNSRLNNLKKNKILAFYKKFEIFLSLKKNYNSNFLKKNNRETSVCTYLYLGLCINNLHMLNKLQKVNCVLKIIDKITLNKKNINFCNTKNLIELINLEKKFLKSIYND